MRGTVTVVGNGIQYRFGIGPRADPRGMLRAVSLSQIEYFVAVAEHGGIAPASRFLNVSSPSISTSISQLEDNFQV